MEKWQVQFWLASSSSKMLCEWIQSLGWMRTPPHTGFLQVIGIHRRQSVPWRMLLLAFRRQGKAELRVWAALCSRQWMAWSAPARGWQSRRPKAQCAVLHRSGRGSHPCFPFCCSAIRDKKQRDGEQSKNKDYTKKCWIVVMLPKDYVLWFWYFQTCANLSGNTSHCTVI